MSTFLGWKSHKDSGDIMVGPADLSVRKLGRKTADLVISTLVDAVLIGLLWGPTLMVVAFVLQSLGIPDGELPAALAIPFGIAFLLFRLIRTAIPPLEIQSVRQIAQMVRESDDFLILSVPFTVVSVGLIVALTSTVLYEHFKMEWAAHAAEVVMIWAFRVWSGTFVILAMLHGMTLRRGWSAFAKVLIRAAEATVDVNRALMALPRLIREIELAPLDALMKYHR